MMAFISNISNNSCYWNRSTTASPLPALASASALRRAPAAPARHGYEAPRLQKIGARRPCDLGVLGAFGFWVLGFLGLGIDGWNSEEESEPAVSPDLSALLQLRAACSGLS